MWDFLGRMDTFGEQGTVSAAPKALKELEKPLEAGKGVSGDPMNSRGEGRKLETPFMVHVHIFSLVWHTDPKLSLCVRFVIPHYFSHWVRLCHLLL